MQVFYFPSWRTKCWHGSILVALYVVAPMEGVLVKLFCGHKLCIVTNRIRLFISRAAELPPEDPWDQPQPQGKVEDFCHFQGNQGTSTLLHTQRNPLRWFIWTCCLLNSSYMSCFGHVIPEGVPGETQGMLERLSVPPQAILKPQMFTSAQTAAPVTQTQINSR